jgi:hypothetical protein
MFMAHSLPLASNKQHFSTCGFTFSLRPSQKKTLTKHKHSVRLRLYTQTLLQAKELAGDKH